MEGEVRNIEIKRACYSDIIYKSENVAFGMN